MKQTLDKLYGFIARLVLMLDEELDELRNKKNTTVLNQQKNITDILNKLVKIIIQLNKISPEEFVQEKYDLIYDETKLDTIKALESYKRCKQMIHLIDWEI